MPIFRRRVPAIVLVILLAAIALPAAAVAAPPAQGTPPQPAAGRTLYAQNCAPCHGPTGKGDGPSAPGLNVPATAFADYDTMARLSLTEMFSVTKTGRMARMMPPWSGRMTDQQIWDAVGYAWTLHTSPTEIAMGQAVYAQQCAACHGPDGKGKPPARDLSDFGWTSTVSQKAWADLLSAGRGTMPAFGAKLAAAEQRAVLAYVRSLSLGPVAAAPLAKGTGVISGTVTNQTSGQPLANAAVELGIFDQTSLAETQQTTTDAAGRYRFADLPTDATLIFVARIANGPGGGSFSSEPAHFLAGQTELNLPIAVYEATTDGSGVRADRVHFIMEFDSDRIYFTELIVFGLEGNKAYAGDGAGTLRFTLPPGAEELEISDGALGERYIATAEGFVDTLPLPPGRGTRQVLYRYAVPYTGRTLDLTRAIPYPAANVNALIAEVGAKVTSDQLTDQTVRQTQNGNFISLSGQNVAANQPITLRFSDLPLGVSSAAMTAGETAPATNDRALLLILLGAGGLLTALLVALPLMRRRATPVATRATDDESLVDALARLEIAHQAGELSDAAYRDARLRVKAQILNSARKAGRA